MLTILRLVDIDRKQRKPPLLTNRSVSNNEG